MFEEIIAKFKKVPKKVKKKLCNYDILEDVSRTLMKNA